MRILAVTAVVTVAAAAALIAVSPARADTWDFVLINSTAKEIKSIDLAPAGTDTWQPNKVDPELNVKSFKAGARTTVHFDKDGKQCSFDIRATFADTTTAVWSAVNVCDNSFVTVKLDAAGKTSFTAN